MIGQDPGADGTFPQDFAAWGADAAICDPWINVACLASEYPDRWVAGLDSWTGSGMQIQAKADGMEGAMASGGKWIAPEEWGDAATANDKIAIASSATLSTDGGSNSKCYITTATCQSLGLGDDCGMLQELRGFRDTVLIHRPLGREYVAKYYATAPGMVQEINARPDRDHIYQRVFREGVVPAVDAIRKGETNRAERLFQRFVDQGWKRSLGL